MYLILLLLLQLCLLVESHIVGQPWSNLSNVNEVQFKTVAYFASWAIYGRKYTVHDLPADKLTHVLYAFADVHPETGEVFLTDLDADVNKHFASDSWNELGNNVYGNIKQLFLLKKRYQSLKVLLSIGGWSYTHNTMFAQSLSTSDNRSRFAKSAVQLVQDLGLDGLDIDWEYPSDEAEAENFVKLLSEIRTVLSNYSNQYGGRFLLTVATSPGSENYKYLHLQEMIPYLDFINLMAYDYAGSWGGTAGHQANLYTTSNSSTNSNINTDDAVNYYISKGVPPSKLVIGMPLYGRAFANTEGLGKPCSKATEGSWKGDPGAWDYKVLPQAGAIEIIDEQAVATYSYDRIKKLMISYDNPTIAEKKAEYIISKGLGGAMWWESSGDRSDNRSLITTVVNTFRRAHLKQLDQTPNNLDYPASKYDNLKNGFPGS